LAAVEAEPLFPRALAIREKALGPEHPDMIETRSALSALAIVHPEAVHNGNLTP
jgi:tetratricopeptide repeat protein